MSQYMKIKLDDTTYKTFVDAAETVAKSGVRVPVEQLAETIINTELAGMDAKKNRKAFCEVPDEPTIRNLSRIGKRRGREGYGREVLSLINRKIYGKILHTH